MAVNWKYAYLRQAKSDYDVFDDSVGNVLTKPLTVPSANRYFCRVRAQDRAGNLSAWTACTDGISAVNHAGISLGEAKLLSDTDWVGFSSKPVSAVFSDCFYVEEFNRATGLRIVPVGGMPAGLAVGKLVDIGGPVKLSSDYERWIDATVLIK